LRSLTCSCRRCGCSSAGLSIPSAISSSSSASLRAADPASIRARHLLLPGARELRERAPLLRDRFGRHRARARERGRLGLLAQPVLLGERLPDDGLAGAHARGERVLDRLRGAAEAALQRAHGRVGAARAGPPAVLQLAEGGAHFLLVLLGRPGEGVELRADLLERAAALDLPAVLLLALRVPRLEHGVAGGAEALPKRALVALPERVRLRVLLPARLDGLHEGGHLALLRAREQRLHFRDEGQAARLAFLARAGDEGAKGRERLLEARVQLLPRGGVHAAEAAFAPGTVGLAQVLLDRAQVRGIALQGGHVRGGGLDELLALLARGLALRRELLEVRGGRRVGPLAGAVEALPQRLGHARVLGVERLPLLAQLLHLGGHLGGLVAGPRKRLGPLAELHARGLLAEGFPALEVAQLLPHAAHAAHRGLGERPRLGLEGLHLVHRGTRLVQVPGGERLLGGVQQRVHAVAGGAGFLARGLRLREAALLDHHERGLEAARERGRADGAVERLPALRQLRVVHGGVGGEALGLDHQRLGAGERLQVAVPRVEAGRRRVEGLAGGIVAERRAFRAQRLERLAQALEGLGPVGGGERGQPVAHAPLEPRARGLLRLLAVEARLQGPPRRVAALQPRRVVLQVERLPAAVELDHRREDRAGRARERLELLEDGVGLARPSFAVAHRLQPLLREPRHAAVLVLRALVERLEPFRGAHALGGGEPRLRVPARERELDERGLVAQPRDGGQAPVGFLRLPRHVGADGVGAGGGLEEGARGGGVPGRGGHAPQRARERLADGGVGLRVPRGDERREVGAARRGGGPDLGGGVRLHERGQLGGFGREGRDPEHALGGLGVLVEGRAGEEAGDHGGMRVSGRRGSGRSWRLPS